MSMTLSQSQVQQQASLSVMKRAMDQSEGSADFINKMMSDGNAQALQQIAQPHLGGNIDLKG
ncbi:putative motility protein [Aquibacillus koreensis]|uniref:Motility protein n=2 Tax=Aquibacillus koreensis TaxID=279446 RepID=A0A9X3WQP8_9BACI|nr:putative motility protein [Aquibacillus koreensis]MCT2537262.1 putative motility protein [Aquibacillus koreensis]MDC3421609.1 putative motility protein [Aquibacillus koreensis]